jgi:hypothetical protein
VHRTRRSTTRCCLCSALARRWPRPRRGVVIFRRSAAVGRRAVVRPRRAMVCVGRRQVKKAIAVAGSPAVSATTPEVLRTAYRVLSSIQHWCAEGVRPRACRYDRVIQPNPSRHERVLARVWAQARARAHTSTPTRAHSFACTHAHSFGCTHAHSFGCTRARGCSSYGGAGLSGASNTA